MSNHYRRRIDRYATTIGELAARIANDPNSADALIELTDRCADRRIDLFGSTGPRDDGRLPADATLADLAREIERVGGDERSAMRHNLNLLIDTARRVPLAPVSDADRSALTAHGVSGERIDAVASNPTILQDAPGSADPVPTRAADDGAVVFGPVPAWADGE